MTNPDKTFEHLQEELRKEADLEPKERSKEYENLTLQYFLDHGKRSEDHDLWRECYMLEEMLAIMNRRFMAHNPHERRKLELYQAPAGANGKWSEEQPHALHKYEQEVDQEGRSEKEIDSGRATLYPSTSRQDLEIQAAENYLEATWGIRRKQANKPPSQGEFQQKAIAKNLNPVIGYAELKKELQKAHNSYDAIRQAVGRAIKDGQELGKLPWPIGACAAEYQIIEAETRKGYDHPTPAKCKYQKIHHNGES
jgi:hypothetical protein